MEDDTKIPIFDSNFLLICCNLNLKHYITFK